MLTPTSFRLRFGPVALSTALLLAAVGGCIRVRTEVEPIDINVNVRLKIDRELDQFFGDLDEQDKTLKSEPAPTGAAGEAGLLRRNGNGMARL